MGSSEGLPPLLIRNPKRRVAITRPCNILYGIMRVVRRRLVLGLILSLLLALTSCQQSSADAGLGHNEPLIHPIEVTAGRWISNRQLAVEGPAATGCRCGDPDGIALAVAEGRLANRDAVCLGRRGFLIARMSVPFANGAGADLLIYEWGVQQGGTDDGFSVSVSENGHAWVLIAETIHNDPGQSYASVDLGNLQGDYLFVRIASAGLPGQDFVEGPEILGIQAMHPSFGFGM